MVADGNKGDALLMPAAYPHGWKIIQNARLECDRTFIAPIPDIVLAGRDCTVPDKTITIFHHPATQPFLAETSIPYAYAMPVASNAEAAKFAASDNAKACVAITNRLCAEHYRLTGYQVYRAQEKMPWIILIRREGGQ